MNPNDLKSWINSLTADIEFSYKGVIGSICPFSREDIALCYNGNSIMVNSVEDAMSEPFISGHSLNDVAPDIEIL